VQVLSYHVQVSSYHLQVITCKLGKAAVSSQTSDISYSNYTGTKSLSDLQRRWFQHRQEQKLKPGVQRCAQVVLGEYQGFINNDQKVSPNNNGDDVDDDDNNNKNNDDENENQ
jgi:hypothetical protein